MEENIKPVHNLMQNLSTKQKIGFGLAFVVILSLLIIFMVLVMGIGSNETSVDNDNAEQGSKIVDVTEDTYTNEQGYTVTQEITTYADGGKVITETKMDEYGNITTADPNLITTYFPYQVVRRHTSEDLIDWGFEYTLRYQLQLDEEAKIITATIEYCDAEGDKSLVEQYLDSIPLDLSTYIVNYETFAEDAICEG